MPARSAHSPEARVLRVVPPLSRFLATELRKARADVQLTLAQFSALRLLADHSCSMGEAARTLRITMPTATQLLDGLVSKSLVTRATGDQDRRQVRLEITQEGRRALDQCRSALESFLASALARLPVEQRESLAADLEQLLLAVREAAEAGASAPSGAS